MIRGRPRISVGLGLCILGMVLGAVPSAEGFIEHKILLKDLIRDCEYIFRAKVESVDPSRPAMVVVVESDYKGKFPARRLPINLTGDKENHTPELLKRVAADVPLICFDVFEKNQHMLLAFTHGTWFQVIGTPDGDRIRWAFTHCEIYLRRTFHGTTDELDQIVRDALAGKKAPPPYDPKVKPGFGPELQGKPGASSPSQRGFVPQHRSLPGGPTAGGSVMLGVIALPFLMPIAALLQLLFPTLLRDQWQRYSVAVSVLLTQSTLIILHWALRPWLAGTWWSGERALWFTVVGVAVLGLVVSLVRWSRRPYPATAPARVEFIALAVLLAAGLGWAGYQAWGKETPFLDEMGVVTGAALLGIAHLGVRWVTADRDAAPSAIAESASPAPWRSTELIFLLGLSGFGSALGWHLFRDGNMTVTGAEVRSDWPMARGNPQRTGALRADDPGPSKPKVLWTFDPSEPRGRVMLHSSPTVVDGRLYIGALRQVSAIQDGYLYCVGIGTGEAESAVPLPGGARLWRFSAGDTLRPVFATPIIAGGRIFLGEGYHQDAGCRLICLDARDSSLILWAMPTSSHVESSPCVVASRVYFGAGDDGILCVDAEEVIANGGVPQPKLHWRFPGIHVDVSPLVVEGWVFAGSTVGDKHQDLYAVALDAQTGQLLWQRRHELRVTGSPAWADGRVVFGLGNGKLGQDADVPQGAVWCLDPRDGRELWTFRTGNSVMATPAASDGRVFAPCLDGFCYSLDAATGNLLWKRQMSGPLAASPVVSAGRVYVLTVGGVLSCLDAADGQELWTLGPLGDEDVDDAFSSPVLVEGRLYVAVGGKVLCIGDPP
ncbi:MAG: PQQ-binding-like beta-propeller repeat protein [Gemmatales bacterium]|nr:PQQ-binding-like beta-propeller repeat protein [Gemmatales bacterium]MDW8387659.1 PQQ-binding-like beta-propeller repeat protein [Gemmatales bacterium]